MHSILILSATIVFLTCYGTAQAQLHILDARYGIVGSNGRVASPSCNASASMSKACNGKEFCQVYVDPRYLCPDPAYGRGKSLDVSYMCNGKKQDIVSFPDTAQALLRCTSEPITQTVHGNKQLIIISARYGVVGSGNHVTAPSCDAGLAMSTACNGKTFCQVYVDPRYLCPDPAYGKQKSLEVNFKCNGKSETVSFPDTSQAVIRCE